MLFLLMLCVTGLPLIFHHEIDDLFEEEISAPTMSADTPGHLWIDCTKSHSTRGRTSHAP